MTNQSQDGFCPKCGMEFIEVLWCNNQAIVCCNNRHCEAWQQPVRVEGKIRRRSEIRRFVKKRSEVV